MDSASCEVIHRPALLDAFSKLPPISIDQAAKPLTLPQIYSWIESRGITLRVLQLNDCCFQSQTGKFLIPRLKLDKVDEVYVNTRYFCNGSELMKVVNSCGNLKILISDEMGGVTDTRLLKINPDILASLTGIECHNNTEMGMLSLAQYCRNLKAFVYVSRQNDCCSVGVLCEIIKLNSNLQSIQITTKMLSVRTLLKTISQYCPVIENVLIDLFLEINPPFEESERFDFTVSDVLATIQSAYKLVLLCVNCESLNFSYVYSKMSSILKMESIVVKNYKDRDGDLAEYFSHCGACTDIIVEDMPTVLTNSMLLQLLSNSYQCMSYLAVVNCLMVSAATLKTVLQSCKSLKTLHVSCEAMKSDEIVSIFEPRSNANNEIVDSTLESIHFYQKQETSYDLSALTIVSVIKMCPRLKSLHMGFCSDINRDMLSHYLDQLEGKGRKVCIMVGSVSL